MKPVTTFDEETKVGYIKLREGPIRRTKSPFIVDRKSGERYRIDMNIDYDDEDKIVGIEILL